MALSNPGFDYVLLPYEFTLFSNYLKDSVFTTRVLLPYEFTLFSNKVPVEGVSFNVLLPYEFTLFSNYVDKDADTGGGFTTL